MRGTTSPTLPFVLFEISRKGEAWTETCPQNLYVEAPPPRVTVFGDGASQEVTVALIS